MRVNVWLVVVFVSLIAHHLIVVPAAGGPLETAPVTASIHEDAVVPGQRVLIVDDVIATGGTAKAVAELVEGLGGVVDAYAFLIELEFLKGRTRLDGYEVLSLLRY
jgi:adenine phosphoribosyltransferase